MPRRRLLHTRLLPALVPLAVFALGACSEDSGLSEEEQEYADAFAASIEDDEDGFGAEPEDAQCMGDAVMEELGVEPFEEADVAPDDIEGSDDGSPGVLLGDGTISEAQAEAIVGVWDEECTDVVDLLVESAGSEFDLDPEGEDCFADQLGDGDLAERLLVSSFTDADGTPDDATVGDLLQVLEDCAGDEASPIVQAIAESLAADGGLTGEQAECLAQGLVDELGTERMGELFSSGAFEDLDAAGQNEVAGALLAAAEDCGVSPSDFGG